MTSSGGEGGASVCALTEPALEGRIHLLRRSPSCQYGRVDMRLLSRQHEGIIRGRGRQMKNECNEAHRLCFRRLSLPRR